MSTTTEQKAQKHYGLSRDSLDVRAIFGHGQRRFARSSEPPFRPGIDDAWCWYGRQKPDLQEQMRRLA